MPAAVDRGLAHVTKEVPQLLGTAEGSTVEHPCQRLTLFVISNCASHATIHERTVTIDRPRRSRNRQLSLRLLGRQALAAADRAGRLLIDLPGPRDSPNGKRATRIRRRA